MQCLSCFVDLKFSHVVPVLLCPFNDSLKQLENFTPTYLLYPYEPDVNITVFGHQTGLNPFASNYASTVTYDRTNGKLLTAVDGRKANAAVKVFDSFRELHFGSFAGLGSKLIWCILGLSPLFLGLSGLYIWWHRNRKKSREKQRTGKVEDRHSSTAPV